MSKENGLSDKITENIMELIKSSSLFHKISSLTNKANKTIYGVGSFCLVVTVFTVMNYNKTKFTIDIIKKQLSCILDTCYYKNKNIDKIQEKVTNIEVNIDKFNNDIFDIKIELKNLSLFLNSNWNYEKNNSDKSTSIHPLEFLTLEDICGENYQEKSIQTEEKYVQTEENEILKMNLPKNIENNMNCTDQDDIMNECYDIIPCNNIKKYTNNSYNLFF